MEKAKKICRKKRNLAKSIISLMLVFAMVISNVQTSSGMLSTVWAAESEAQTLDGEAETGSVDEGNDSDGEETGETQKSLESEEANSEERSEAASESTQAGESEQSEETSESGSTETTTTSAVETETASETETETEEESNAFLGDGAGEENPVAEQIDIKLHFKDVLGWKTDANDIQVAYSSYQGSDWVQDYNGGSWPGVALTEDSDGYYTLNLENVTKPTGDGFVFVFHNGNGTQTNDYVIPMSAFSGESAEYWIFAAKAGSYGKHPAQICSKAINTSTISPEISEDGSVTFKYFNCFETSTVKVAGDMTSWGDNAILMEDKTSSGVFTATTDVLEAGEHKYKFILGTDTWINDPNNDSFADDGNNKFTISGSTVDENASPVVDGNTVTFRYANKDASDVYVRGQMTDWSVNDDYKMTKNAETGVHTLEVELTHGAYEYKFYYKTTVGGEEKEVWLRDPKNELKTDTADPNSIVYVPGTEQYEYTIHYYNPDAAVPTTPDGPDLHIWDKCPGAAEGQQYDFTEITKDADEEKGKTWLTTTVTVPYPHINIIARPEGDWVTGVTEKEWTYELKKDAKTAEIWFVYGEGLYDKNPFLETYTYTIHYYNPAAPNQESSAPDLYVWGAGTANPGKLYSFAAEKLDDTDNGIKWLTTEVDTPYKKIGLFGKPTAGDSEAGWDGQDKDRFYQLKGEAKEAELWYIHGMGVYEEKPMIKLDSVGAALSLESMDYTQNSVLSLVFNGNEDSKVLIQSASVDASALGISDNLTIDPQLCEVTLSVRDNIAPGTYTLPVTVESVSGEEMTAEASVTVKEKTGSDFDWDEAVIYFMVTDRFFDGDSSNNAANGAKTAGDNPGLYHGGDFAGVTAKLDELKELGVNTIWITPIVENIEGVTVSGTGSSEVPFYAGYHGYWASDFTQLNPALGTEQEFETLISTAHEKGMKIMVDVVVNHAGYGIEETDKFPGMLRDKADVNEEDHELGGYQAGLPDFLTEIPEVRDQIIQWQVDWAKKGVDFFRVDTVQHVDDTTWRAFKNELTKANPNFKMIGEYFGAGYNSGNGNRIGNGQMDSLLDFNFNEWATDFVSGNISSVETNLANRNKALNNTYLTGQFLSSHDEDGFKQNLIDKKWSEDAAAAASYVAATLQITAKGQPVIYYGEEIGLTGNNNYPYQTNRYDYNWSELAAQKTQSNSIYNHYKKMLSIRNDYSEVFAKGDRAVVASSNQEKYDVVSRSYNNTTLYVGMNIDTNTEKTVTISVNNKGINGYRDLYSDQVYTVAEDGTVTVTIPAAKDGGTVVLAADSYTAGLMAPDLTTIAKGKTTTLPKQLVKMSESGEETLVDVTYEMESIEGVTLDAANRKITVAESFDGNRIKLKATAGSDTVEFELKVVEDKNEITVRLHYHRPDGNYENWNIWTWDASSSAVVDFTSDDENGGKVAEIILPGRATSVMNYIIRKSVPGNEWAEKDVANDCYIDLSEVLSGTVDYYVESKEFPGKRVLGDDVLIGVKLLSVAYSSQKNTIKVVTGTPITRELDNIFILKRSDGTEIPITGVKLANKDKNEYEVSIGADLSGLEEISKNYSLFFDEYEYKVTMPSVYSSDKFETEYTYDGNDLGAVWSKEKTTFKVWAPTADKVQVNLYKSGTEGTDDLIETLEMTKGEKGVWAAEKEGDLNGTYYTYRVTVDGSTTEACDPYAKTTGVNGNRAMVINMDATNPAGWAEDRGPNAGMSYTDSVIYELHVRDFSIDASSGISDKNKGKFLGLTEKGTTNETGQTTGLDYLTDLGVTHIHLLPSYDYATVDETKLDEPQYNWGYDPKNYNVPEGSYSTDPYNGDVRVKEMKQMIKTLHDNNINVIMDVVYNHVYDADKFCFNQLVPKYFSRTNADGTYSSGSGCGNDTASERSMVKKYIVDSVNYWADEYHIDGFRFDLVGLLDTDTINEVVNTVHEKHPDAVFYGEGWTMNTAVSKDGYTMATQANSAETPQFAYFSDTIRNLLKGDTFSHESTGFVSGKTGQEELLAKCFTATTDWCKSPTQTVNYASCHDNYSLMDKLSVSRKDASFEERTKMNNLAAAIYMTAEGIPLIHAAEELLREKLDKNGEPVENSYNSSDLVNSIKWSNLDKEAYRNVRDYYKGLIAFRKNHAALRLTTAAEIKANVKYNWVSNELVMFVINGKDIAAEVSDGIVVIFNANTEAKDVDLYNYGVTEGTWNICINDQKAGIETLASVTDGKVTVAPISALVLVKGETKDNESVYDKIEQQKIEQLLKELNALIAQFEKEEQGNRTEETWTAFQTALQEARDAAGKTGVTAEELSLAKSNLQAAHDALKVPEGTVDKEMLKALAATYKEIFNAGQGSYTAESWNAFSEELAKAEALIENAEATQEEINQAYSDLETAYKNLTSTKNTENLDALIAEYSKLEKGDYTDESWNALQEALKAAKEIADKPNATQDEINKAEQDLRDAYTALKVPEGTIDKQKLNALIAVCDEIFNKGQGSYTAESWNAFTSALEEAKAVRDKADASQTEVDEARDRLDKAHHNLVSIEEEIKALKELIASCEKYTKDDYTTESWIVFEDALQAAKKAAENPNAALDEIQRAADDLQNAVNELIKVKQGLWTAWAPDSGLTAPENSEGKYHIAYAGKAFKPEIFVYDGKTKLKEKTDYTVSYKNNTNAGTATVTIKGKGNYAESITEEFIIDPIDLATLEIEDLYAAVASNNTKQAALKPVVKFNGKALKAGKDYTVAYKDPNGGKTPGNPSMEYDVTIDAVSVNFTGSKMIKMTLVDKDSAYLMSKASIGKIAKADMVYTGKVLQPQITVKYGKATLIKDTDYTVLYDDEHTEAGETATITIRGNGTTYFGEKTTSFKITGTPLKANQISLKDVPKTGLVYTGKAQTPEIDGIDKQNYEVVYQNNTNVGTAAVLITGKNGYTGTVKKTFKITAYDITASDKKFEYNINGSIPYAKGGSKLTDEQVGASFTINDGAVIKLQQGTDYTLSYKNNKKVGEGTVTIKGKGNYKGTIKNIPFTIAAQDLAVLEDTTTAADVLKKNAKKFNKVIPVITDLDGKTLKNKTDFEINAATAYTDKDGNVISSTEPEVGTAIKVTATGKGNYKGTVSATFYIIEDNMSIAKAAVQVDPQQYTGSEVTLRKDQIHVKLKINGALTELQEKDFEIVGYSKNIKKGTAKVTIRGLYPYGGTKTVNFKITACPLN